MKMAKYGNTVIVTFKQSTYQGYSELTMLYVACAHKTSVIKLVLFHQKIGQNSPSCISL